MKNDLISIIIPVYKVEKYLEKCIESVLKQTYTNLQIILVDDGSPDNCGKICDEYAKKDSRIEVIHKANGGLSDARNVGISKAKGRYIGFVDSDDYIKEDMYEILLNLIKKYDADVSICNLYDVIDENECIRNKENGIREYSRLDILKEVLLDKNIQSYAWNKLYEKELFDEIKYPIGKKYEDIGTTFYVFEKCNKIVVTSEPEYYYLKRSDSLVNNVTESTVLDYTEIIIQRYLYTKENIKELKKYNVKTIMLTGDNKQTAEKIGKELEITEVISNVLPSQKSDTIKSLKENGNKVMMCGDGINDSPAITNADIGVSVKSGTDIAMDSSDVILTKNDLYSILKLIKISEKTVKNIKQNLFWAFFYNCLMIPVAIGFFKPLGISINPMIASLAMVFSSLTVILNALRLKNK